MAEHSSDPRVAHPDVKVQVRDLLRVVGIVAPFAPWGSIPGEIRFIETQWVNGQRRLVPDAANSGTHGRARQSQGRDRVGIVEESCGNRVRGVSNW